MKSGSKQKISQEIQVVNKEYRDMTTMLVLGNNKDKWLKKGYSAIESREDRHIYGIIPAAYDDSLSLIPRWKELIR